MTALGPVRSTGYQNGACKKWTSLSLSCQERSSEQVRNDGARCDGDFNSRTGRRNSDNNFWNVEDCRSEKKNDPAASECISKQSHQSETREIIKRIRPFSAPSSSTVTKPPSANGYNVDSIASLIKELKAVDARINPDTKEALKITFPEEISNEKREEAVTLATKIHIAQTGNGECSGDMIFDLLYNADFDSEKMLAMFQDSCDRAGGIEKLPYFTHHKQSPTLGACSEEALSHQEAQAKSMQGELAKLRLRALHKEEMYLKKMFQCIGKDCQEKAEITFLPCGHFVACSTCAQTCFECPRCNHKILGEARTFLA